MATEAEVRALADVMWQLLDDMGDGLSVCAQAKALARVAYEPFRDGYTLGMMPLDEAKEIIAEVERNYDSLGR